MNSAEPIAALEIGTTHTMIAIAEPLGEGRIRVAAYGSIPSSGSVHKSQVVDVAKARYSVSSVQKKLVSQSDYAVAQAYLVVSGPQIRTQEASAQVPLPRGVVSDEDIEEIGERMYDITLPAERQALEVARISYGLDDIENIVSPKGMSGHILKLRTLCIHGSAQRIADAKNAADAAKLEILDVCYAGTSAAAAVLTPQQKQDGALVIDLGGGSTNFTAWVDGRLLYADVIGVGGDHVTEDIRDAFTVSVAQAEQLKLASASAMIGPDDASVRIPLPATTPGFNSASISLRALNTVVNARMSELFTIVRTKIDEAELTHRLNAGVFLTGGGSSMKNVLPLASNIFGRPVLLGKLVPEVEGLENEKNPAALATIVGTLLQTVPAEPSRRSFMDLFSSLFGGKKKK
jgi:cell division protein FtsA